MKKLAFSLKSNNARLCLSLTLGPVLRPVFSSALSLVLAVLITLVDLPASQPAMAQENNLLSEQKQQECKQPLNLKGAPNRIESVAKMRAIIIWSEQVSAKYNVDHSFWHNAKNKSVDCKKSRGSSYFYCELTATPCNSSIANTTSP